MNCTRRVFLQQSATVFSTLSLTGCMSTQVSQGNRIQQRQGNPEGCVCSRINPAAPPGLTCCDNPFLEPESLTVGEKTLRIDLTKAPSLRYAGSTANIALWDKSIQIIVVRPAKKEFYALRRMCTHGNQTVSYNPQRGILQCNNYNHSIFALNGDVIKGPAPSPLPTYAVNVKEGILEIVL